MAFAGHKFTQTPHKVHSTTSTICGFLFLPSSKTPWGQTPTQMSPAQDVHLEVSIRITDFCILPIEIKI
ncbi:MAG: hypothetical protein ABSF65_04270 [Candidatus Bathyarchaeia archaeon]